MALLDRVNKEIVEIDRQIARVQNRADEELKDLRRRKQALILAAQVISPELEAAMAALEAVGITLR